MKKVSSSIKSLALCIATFFTLLSANVYAVPETTDNPYINKLIKIINDFKGYGLTVIGIITVAKVVQYGIQYQGGSDDEKVQAVKLIRKTLIMGGGIFFLVWLATYIITEMSGIEV